MGMVKIDTKAFDQWTTGDLQNKQLPFATALALTNVAKLGQTAIVASMKAKFDRPTPFTLNSTFVKPATKTNLTASVQIKDTNVKGSAPSVFLQPQIQGGPRQQKRSEFLLQRKGVLPAGMFMMPGAGARLDQYGNMSRGQLIQVLSALQSNYTSGYVANRTANSFDRSKTQQESFVAGPNNPEHLPLGIYLRGRNHQLKPILLFVSQPHYKPKIPFFAIAGDVYSANIAAEFAKAMVKALATANP